MTLRLRSLRLLRSARTVNEENPFALSTGRRPESKGLFQTLRNAPVFRLRGAPLRCAQHERLERIRSPPDHVRGRPEHKPSPFPFALSTGRRPESKGLFQTLRHAPVFRLRGAPLRCAQHERLERNPFAPGSRLGRPEHKPSPFPFALSAGRRPESKGLFQTLRNAPVFRLRAAPLRCARHERLERNPFALSASPSFRSP